jgi:hypothetical protein
MSPSSLSKPTFRSKEHMADEQRSKFCFSRAATVRFLLVVASLLWVSPANGQVQRTIGVHLGQVRSRQIWSGPSSTAKANGPSVGVNVDVPTPASFLSIRAEIGYVRRGSVIWDDEVDPEHLTAANVRSHYLSIPILGKVKFGLGPASFYLLAGPTLDHLLKTECGQALCSALNDDRPTAVGVTVGSGTSIDFRDRFRGDLEVRLTEGLTDAYVSRYSGVHYRSLEFLLRACFPF